MNDIVYNFQNKYELPSLIFSLLIVDEAAILIAVTLVVQKFVTTTIAQSAFAYQKKVARQDSNSSKKYQTTGSAYAYRSDKQTKRDTKWMG